MRSSQNCFVCAFLGMSFVVVTAGCDEDVLAIIESPVEVAQEPETREPEAPEVCLPPLASDDRLVWSAAVSTLTVDDNTQALVRTPTLVGEGVQSGREVAWSLKPTEHTFVDFETRNQEAISLDDLQLFIEEETVVLQDDQLPSSTNATDWRALLDEDYDASHVNAFSKPGYSCDATQAIVYIEKRCGASCTVAYIARVDWIEGTWEHGESIELWREAAD